MKTQVSYTKFNHNEMTGRDPTSVTVQKPVCAKGYGVRFTCKLNECKDNRYAGLTVVCTSSETVTRLLTMRSQPAPTHNVTSGDFPYTARTRRRKRYALEALPITCN